MNLDFFFTPKSVAIIGASNRKGSMGYVFMNNITNAGYEGEIYPINPKEDEVFGLRAYKNIKDIPADVDLAVVLIPAFVMLFINTYPILPFRLEAPMIVTDLGVKKKSRFIFTPLLE